jgi:hypothetical protein
MNKINKKEMNKYRKEYCEENGKVSINPENTALYDYIKHLENKLAEAEQLRLCGVGVRSEQLVCGCGRNHTKGETDRNECSVCWVKIEAN